MIAEELKLVIKAEVDKATADLRKFQQTATQSKAATSSLGAGIAKMALAFGAAFLSVAALRKGLSEAMRSAKLAAEASQVSRAFENMASRVGASGDQIIGAMSDAANATISKLAMMKAANRAALFDIPLDKLDELMKIANASATAMGQSVEYMFDTIVTGIGRASPLILDNLGLQIKAEAAIANYAKSLGKSADELTEVEKRQATLNEVLRTGADLMAKVGAAGSELTDLQKWEQLTAAIADLRVEMGKKLLPVISPIVQWLTKVAREAATATREIAAAQAAVAALSAGEKIENISDSIAGLNRKRAELVRLIEMQSSAEAKASGAADEINKDTLRRIASIDAEIGAMQNVLRWQALGAKEAARMTEESKKQAAAAEALAAYLKDVRMEYAKTPEGMREVIDAQIALREAQLATAVETKPQLIAIIAMLKKEREALDDVKEAMDDISRASLFGTDTEAEAEAFLMQLDAVKNKMDELRESTALLQETIEKAFGEAVVDTFIALGTAMVDAASGAEAMKGVVKSLMVTVLQALAKEAWAYAAFYAALGRFGKAAAMGAAGAAALVAAGVVAALAEGGIVTKPTTALIGERGPEAVIPLNKMGSMGNITINVQGSVISKEELFAEVAKYQTRTARAW